jgi:hypothetical protein
MTFHHTASSTKTVKFRRMGLRLLEVSAAGVFGFEIRRIGTATDPATGNPAITAMPFNPGLAAAELSDGTLGNILCLPTTEGNDVAANQAIGTTFMELGVAAADSTVNPSAVPTLIELYKWSLMDETEPLTLRAATREGYAIYGYGSVSATVKFTCFAEFTEE